MQQNPPYSRSQLSRAVNLAALLGWPAGSVRANMRRIAISVTAMFLSCTASLAGPDDEAARKLSDINIQDCRTPPASSHIEAWRHDTVDENGQPEVLWGFPCDTGLKNVWVLWTVVYWREREGYQIVSLAIPNVSSRGVMSGMRATTTIRGASYDPESRTLSASYDNPLGLNRQDIGSYGEWQLYFGDFWLVNFSADVFFDEKLELLPIISFDRYEIP